MDICKDIPISVSVPVSLDENTKSVFDIGCSNKIEIKIIYLF